MRLQLLFLALILPLAALGGDLPSLIYPAGAGVNIHFVTGHEHDLLMIQRAGFKWIRMDFAWESIEKKKDVYDWSAYDELLANLDKHGLRALFILDYSNPLYEEQVGSKNPLNNQQQQGTASPQHPESVAAFAKWAAAAAAHYSGRGIIWEIWNEPNIFFWKPKPNAGQYATLALAACRAIREADSRATIIGPACSTFDWSFLETFFKSGILGYLDAVSVHPYREKNQGPETAAADYHQLRELISRYAPDAATKKMPILSGEWGYSSATGELSSRLQGAYLARQQLSNLLRGIRISIWYDWKDDGPNPAEHEHNFGAVHDNLSPKPAYLAAQILNQELSGYQILRRLESDKQDFLLMCVNSSGGCKLAVWTTGTAHQLEFPLPMTTSEPITGKTIFGDEYKPAVKDGKITVDLDESPKYLGIK